MGSFVEWVVRRKALPIRNTRSSEHVPNILGTEQLDGGNKNKRKTKTREQWWFKKLSECWDWRYVPTWISFVGIPNKQTNSCRKNRESCEVVCAASFPQVLLGLGPASSDLDLRAAWLKFLLPWQDSAATFSFGNKEPVWRRSLDGSSRSLHVPFYR